MASHLQIQSQYTHQDRTRGSAIDGLFVNVQIQLSIEQVLCLEIY